MSARTQQLIEKIEECKELLLKISNNTEEQLRIQTEIVKYEKELIEFSIKDNKNLLLG